MAQMQAAESALRAQIATLATFRQAGKKEEADKLEAMIRTRSEKLKQFKQQWVHAFAAQHAAASGKGPANAPGASGQAPSSQSAGGGASGPAPAPAKVEAPAAKQDARQQGPMSTPVMAAAKSVAAVGAGAAAAAAVLKPPPTQQISPEMAVQIQKLMNQQKIQQGQQGSSMQAGPSAPAAEAKPAIRGAWQGTLSWRGFDSETHVRKDVFTRVLARCPPDHAANM